MLTAALVWLALTPDEVAAPPATAAQPVREASIREAHPLVLRVDIGWNTLAGLGLGASWAATPHLIAEVGAGFVLSGPKAGARVRWNLTTGDLTPFIAIGGIWSAGRGAPQTVNQGKDDEFSFHVGQAAYVQGTAGLDYQDGDRVSYRFEVGWAQALGHRDLHVVAGTPTKADWNEVRFISGGGPVLGGSVGYAF